MGQSASTFLWYGKDGEAAVDFDVSLFPGARLISKQGIGPGMSIVEFALGTQRFTAMTAPGGPAFSEAASIHFPCTDQAEIDRLWAALADGGTELKSGWVRDRFGLAWQIVPAQLAALMAGGTPQQSQAVMAAMMPMVRIKLAALQAAFDKAG